MVTKQNGSAAWIIHPLLFAVWPVLDLYARHASEVSLRDLLSSLAAVSMATLVLFALLQRILKNARLAGVLVTGGIVPWFLYGAIANTATNILEQFGLAVYSDKQTSIFHWTLLVALLATVLCFYRFSLKNKCQLQPLTSIANLMAGVLILFALYRIGNDEVRYWSSRSARSSSAQWQSESLVSAETIDGRLSTPDIYYLVFDRYANSSTLASAYHFDNHEFLAHLESKGFFVADKSRCNYAMTLLSLASTLNMRYHQSMVGTDLVERDLSLRHEVGMNLEALGYRIINGRKIFDWELSSATSPSDDDFLDLSTWTDTRTSTSFTLALMAMTPIGPWLIPEATAKRHVREFRRQFQMVKAASTQPGPKFVLAHFLLPHPPFAFQENGIRPCGEVTSGSKKGYIEQLKYANQTIEKLVDIILANSRTPPVIVLQSDEGPYLREDDFAKSRKQKRRIRTGILNALYLPGKPIRSLDQEMSPVNTFRLVFHDYFDIDIELLEDKVFVWPFSESEKPKKEPWKTGSRFESCGFDFPGKQSHQKFVFRDVTREIATDATAQPP